MQNFSAKHIAYKCIQEKNESKKNIECFVHSLSSNRSIANANPWK